MLEIPRLYTSRLVLRPFSSADAKRIQELAGDRRVAATTTLIPHPYPDGAAEAWINSLPGLIAAGKRYPFAVTLAGTRTPGWERNLNDTGHLIGSISLCPDDNQPRANLGYWIGVPYWNKGFATEAARAILDFGFNRLKLHRIYARHFSNNPASGQVMKKLGMTFEGILRGHDYKWGEFLDNAMYGILREEWIKLRTTKRPPQVRRELVGS